MSYATIKLKLFKGGMMFSCEEADIEEIVPLGDSNKLIDLINEVDGLCNPDATFAITEKRILTKPKRRKQ